MKKVWKNIRPFRYDLNQIRYDYTVEVTNTSKGLGLVDRVLEELWKEVHNIVHEVVIKTISKKKKFKKAKWLSEEALKIAEKRRKMKREEKKNAQLNAALQRIARRDKIAFLSEQCKEIKENNRMGKTKVLFKKIGDTKGIFHAKMGTIKDINGKGLREEEEIEKSWQEYTEELCKKKVLMTWKTTMVCSLTKSQTPWNVKSSGS